jgi:arylsulfatase A-like enzyme
MVLVDDMRWDEMRVAGHPFIATPNMDRLAREGARFRNAFATTSLCSPSRASFLTGQYPHTNGIIDNIARPSHSLRVFPLELQRAGSRTGFLASGTWEMTTALARDSTAGSPCQAKEAIDPSLNVDGKRVHAKGYTTDLLTDYVERFIGPSFGSSVPGVLGAQDHPSQCDSARRWECGADPWTARWLCCRGSPPRSLRRSDYASARKRFQAAARETCAASPD